MKKTAACLLAFFFLAGCMGLRGKSKARYIQPEFKAPDIVGMLPADNHSNDLRADNTVQKVMAGVLISLGYLPLFSPAQTQSLQELGLTDGGQLKAFKSPQLASALGADSLFHTTIAGFNDLNAGVYMNRSVDLEMALTDTVGEKLWEVEAHSTNRMVQGNILAGLASRIAENAVLKALNLHMLREASKAALEAHKKIPEWPEASPEKLRKIQNDIK